MHYKYKEVTPMCAESRPYSGVASLYFLSCSTVFGLCLEEALTEDKRLI